jgi:hypothetical protein
MTTGKSLPEVLKTSGQIRNHRDETNSAMATTVLAGNTSSARCRTITVCYKTLQIGLETSLQ